MESLPAIPAVRFSSRELPRETRMEYLLDFYARVSMGIELEPLVSGEAFQLDLSVQPLSGNAGVGHGSLSPYRARRTPGIVATGNSDGVLLTRFTRRFSFSGHGADDLTLEAGDVLVANFNQPCGYLYPDAGDIQTLWLDRKQLLARAPAFDPDAPAHLDGRRPELALLFAYATAIEHAGIGDGALGQLASMHLADLAGLALGASGDEAEAARAGGQKAARLAAIRADLAADFQNTDLSATSVAQRHGISVRYLQVLFEQSGQTFSDCLLEHRLRFALSQLSDPRCSHLRVADIAFESGFADLTTFNRAFRRRFGDTPSSVRP